MSLPAEISVSQLRRMRDEESAFTLLDVREADELAVAKLDWARHIPMGDVPARAGELRKDDDIVVMCHGGFRSDTVARYLRDNGFQSVANLAGGIDAWSTQIDPSVPTY